MSAFQIDGKDSIFASWDNNSVISTRRTFKPNVQRKTFFSDILEKKVKLNVTTSAIRCIDKAGGFDKFIINSTKLTRDSDIATKLRSEMLKVKQQRLEAKQTRAATSS